MIGGIMNAQKQITLILLTLALCCRMSLPASAQWVQKENTGPTVNKTMSPAGVTSFVQEGFEGQQFPPPGWTLVFTGPPYWERFPRASGYGVGTASAVFRFYYAPVGRTQSLELSALGPTVPGDSLRFDHAYATYQTENDRLIIQTSTDGGSTYDTLVTLNGGLFGSLVTAQATTAEFVPAANEWATKQYALPPGTNRVRFTAVSALGNNLFLDNCTFGNRAATDVGVQTIDIPNPTLTLPQIPRTTVQNHGTTMQTLTVTMSISPGGYTSTHTVTGLASNATSQVSFDTWIPAVGSYNIKAFTSLSGDLDNTNDTVRAAIVANQALSPVTNISAFFRDGQVFVTWTNLTTTNVVYTLYRSSNPIDFGYQLASAQNLGNVRDNSSLNDRLTMGNLKIDSASPPLTSDKGLFVATSTTAGSFYYALTTGINGLEDTTIVVGSNSIASPVNETVMMPKPVWQGDRIIDGKTFNTYVGFATKVTSSIYPQMTNSGTFPFNFAIVKSGTVSPHPVTFWMHPTCGDFLGTCSPVQGTGDPNEWVVTIDDEIPNNDAYSFYYGFHEDYDIHSNKNPIPESGTLYNYTSARVAHIVNWAIRNLPVDSTRTYMTGWSMGAIGALFNSIMIREKIAAIFIYCPRIEMSQFWMQRLWGTYERNLLTNEGYRRNDRLNAGSLVSINRSNSLPLMFIFCGKTDVNVGWDEKIPFYDSVNASKQGAFQFWSMTDHIATHSSSPWQPSFPDFSFFTRYRTNLSYPAFTNCSINDNPGNGDSTDGDAIGSINGHLDWNDNIVDSTYRWEITLKLKDLSTIYGPDIAPDSATTDVTLRRLQAFRVPPHSTINWENVRNNVIVQQDSLAYNGGPITIPGVKVYKDSSRLIVEAIVISVSSTLSKGWNMVSVPVSPTNDSVKILFPSAVGDAFSYNGSSYLMTNRLNSGAGYWLKFAGAEDLSVTGAPSTNDTLNLASGWNMIGSISVPLAVSSIMSIPAQITTSNFFGYSGKYEISDSILPGRAYWVKVKQNGRLVLSSSAQASPSNMIRMVPSDELPPAPPDEDVTSIDLPKKFALAQSYPNPFNPTATIRYDLPTASRVSLTIYNLLGQVVATLVDGVVIAGYQSAEWNASNFSSGIYFYRLEATSVSEPSKTFNQVRKMVLLK